MAREFRVGLVLDKGGRDDKSFNAAAVKGAQEAELKLPGVKVKIIEGRDDNPEPIFRNLVDKKYDLVIAIGFSQAQTLEKVAKASPSARFVLVDAEIKDVPNVQSIIFEEHEGAFLVGAIAGWTTKTGKVGFIGGMDIPLIRRFLMGYEAGVRYALKKDAVITSHFAGVTGAAWNNPPKGKELALTQYASGVDIIFAAAGATGLGVFDGAESQKKLAIGVDSNQNGIKPGYVLTSMIKKVDVAVFDSIKDSYDGGFKPGPLRLGLKDGGVDFAMDQHNKSLIPDSILAKANQLKSDLIAHKVKAPDFYQRSKP